MLRKANARTNRTRRKARSARTPCIACGTPNGGEMAMMSRSNHERLMNVLRSGATLNRTTNSPQNATQTNQFTDNAAK